MVTENSVRAENAGFRSFVRSWYYHDELSFRRLFLTGRLQFSEPVPHYRRRSSRFVTNSPFLQKNAPPRLRLQRSDRFLCVLLSRCWPGWRRSLHIVRADTVIAWHRRAFAWYWTRKSRRRPGRPNVAAEIRDLIRNLSQAKPFRSSYEPKQSRREPRRIFLCTPLFAIQNAVASLLHRCLDQFSRRECQHADEIFRNDSYNEKMGGGR
jgi:hypothetical protein